MPLTTSVDLLGRLRTGQDCEAWQGFLRTYEPFIEAWLRTRGLDSNHAADVRQDVMVVLIQELPKFEHNGNAGAFRCWLRQVMTNRLRTYVRKRTNIRGVELEALLATADSLSHDDGELVQSWDREHNAFLIERLLQQVATDFSPQTLKAFRQQVIAERSAADVAESLNMSKASVIAAKSRVIRRLREQVQDMDLLL